MQISNKPIIGGTAPRNAIRTGQKLASFAHKYFELIEVGQKPLRFLDVGCGNGFITGITASNFDFDEIVGVDLEGERLEEFKADVRNKPKYRVSQMSASKLEFPNQYFSLVTAFEVLEHVEELGSAATEINRVCRPGGIIVISVPQVWFPIENHGCRIGGTTYEGKVPLLPYVRSLHRKLSVARVFSSSELDRLFVTQGLELLATGYAAPQFERASNRENSWEKNFVFLRSFLTRCENIPFLRAFTGVSMLKAYRKPLR